MNYRIRMKHWPLLLLILPLLTACPWDEKPALPQVPCYEIAPASKFKDEILLDKCTGISWLLVRTTLVDAKGKETGAFTYRWYPITRETYGEPEMTRGL